MDQRPAITAVHVPLVTLGMQIIILLMVASSGWFVARTNNDLLAIARTQTETIRRQQDRLDILERRLRILEMHDVSGSGQHL